MLKLPKHGPAKVVDVAKKWGGGHMWGHVATHKGAVEKSSGTTMADNKGEY